MKPIINAIFALCIYALSTLPSYADRIKITQYGLQKVPTSKIHHYIGDDSIQSGVGDNVLILSLKTKPSLLGIIERKGHYLSASGWFCDRPKQQVYVSRNQINLQNHQLWKWSVPEPYGVTQEERKKLFKRNKDDLRYHVVLYTKWTQDSALPIALRKDKTQEKYLKFDYNKSIQDVCFQITGGLKLFFGWSKSNVIRIPAAQIARALK